MRVLRILAAVVGAIIVLLMAWYLGARNYSAYFEQPGWGSIAYRLVASLALLVPGLILWVLGVRAGRDRFALTALALTIPWFVVAGTASFMLGV